jgi:OmpA-OmpF porin, OOP family
MPRSKPLAVLMTGLCLLSPAARAQETPLGEPPLNDRYLAFLAGYVTPDEELVAGERGNAVSALYGWQLSPHFSLEFNFTGSIFETGTSGATDFYQQSLSVEGVFNFTTNRGAKLTPYAVLGVGIARDDLFPDDRDDNAVIGNVGLGFVTRPLTRNGMRLRVEARYVHDDVEEGYAMPRLSVGLEFPLGGGPREKNVEFVTEMVKVEVPKEVPRPWIDDDGDGVDNDHDRCPGTPKGLRADATGCVFEHQRIELRGVNFEFGKARLTPTAANVLDLIASGIVSQPGLRLEVAGHTDSVGSADANQKLSRARAESVRAYLISKGVAARQLTAVGYGESEPLVSPETGDADRERNRRVELRVLSAPAPGAPP